jgi:hypothetical protein
MDLHIWIYSRKKWQNIIVRLRPGVSICPECNASHLDGGPKQWYLQYKMTVSTCLDMVLGVIEKGFAAKRFESAVRVFGNLLCKIPSSPFLRNLPFLHIEQWMTRSCLYASCNHCNSLMGLNLIPCWRCSIWGNTWTILNLLNILNQCTSLTGVGDLIPYWRSSTNVIV